MEYDLYDNTTQEWSKIRKTLIAGVAMFSINTVNKFTLPKIRLLGVDDFFVGETVLNYVGSYCHRPYDGVVCRYHSTEKNIVITDGTNNTFARFNSAGIACGSISNLPTKESGLYLYYATNIQNGANKLFGHGVLLHRLYDQNVWLDDFGTQFTRTTAGGTVIRSIGTFAEKPSNVQIGYRYFCTDKQTTEGATDGIEIIHKGNNVWVDALGRVVS